MKIMFSFHETAILRCLKLLAQNFSSNLWFVCLQPVALFHLRSCILHKNRVFCARLTTSTPGILFWNLLISLPSDWATPTGRLLELNGRLLETPELVYAFEPSTLRQSYHTNAKTLFGFCLQVFRSGWATTTGRLLGTNGKLAQSVFPKT